MNADATIDGQDREETGRTLYESLRMPTTRVWWTSLPEDIREEWRTLAEKGLLGVPPMTSQHQATSGTTAETTLVQRIQNLRLGGDGAAWVSGQTLQAVEDELIAQAAEIQRMLAMKDEAFSALQEVNDARAALMLERADQKAEIERLRVDYERMWSALQAESTAHTQERGELRAEIQRMAGALTQIKAECGAVCPEFEVCTHPWCQSSVAAWMIADEALKARLDADAPAASTEQEGIEAMQRLPEAQGNRAPVEWGDQNVWGAASTEEAKA